MNKPLGIALVVLGLLLIGLGVNASRSLSSDLSRLFSGSPTDKAMLLLMAGVVCEVLGLFLTVGRSTRS